LSSVASCYRHAKPSSHDERRFVIRSRRSGRRRSACTRNSPSSRFATPSSPPADANPTSSPISLALQDNGSLSNVFDLLTPREREVLRNARRRPQRGRRSAFGFGDGPKTMETHRMHLMTKLRVDDLADLARPRRARGAGSGCSVADRTHLQGVVDGTGERPARRVRAPPLRHAALQGTAWRATSLPANLKAPRVVTSIATNHRD